MFDDREVVVLLVLCLCMSGKREGREGHAYHAIEYIAQEFTSVSSPFHTFLLLLLLLLLFFPFFFFVFFFLCVVVLSVKE